MQDYDKNNKPMTSVVATKAPLKQTNRDLAPIAKPFASKSAFNMPTNSVTGASSAKLQKASLLGGRVNLSGGKAPFAK